MTQGTRFHDRRRLVSKRLPGAFEGGLTLAAL